MNKKINTTNYIEGNVTGGHVAGRDIHIHNQSFDSKLEKITSLIDPNHALVRILSNDKNPINSVGAGFLITPDLILSRVGWVIHNPTFYKRGD